MTSSRNSTSKPTYSRNVLHGNSTRGGGAGAIAGVAQQRYFKSKKNHTASNPKHKAQKTDPQQVIVAPPPRSAPLPRTAKGPKELRFTLPDCPANSDFRIAQIRRAYAASQLVMRDLSTELRCRSGSTDERVELL